MGAELQNDFERSSPHSPGGSYCIYLPSHHILSPNIYSPYSWYVSTSTIVQDHMREERTVARSENSNSPKGACKKSIIVITLERSLVLSGPIWSRNEGKQWYIASHFVAARFLRLFDHYQSM